MGMGNCKNCIFFKEDGYIDKLTQDIKYSECRRHAPRVIHGVGTGISDGRWAMVKETDWCGDFDYATHYDKSIVTR